MPTSDPSRFEVQAREGSRLRLVSNTDAAIELFVLEGDIIRMLILLQSDPRGPAMWSVALDGNDMFLEGRGRRDPNGFALPTLALYSDTDTLRVGTSKIRLSVALVGSFCTWQIHGASEW